MALIDIADVRKTYRMGDTEVHALAGVSLATVYNWEHAEGTLKLRSAARTKLQELRGIGVKEARQRLEEMG